MLKLSFLLFFICLQAQAIQVLVTKKAINYEQKLKTSDLRLVNVSLIKKICTPLKLKDIQNNEYITSHYINRNVILCKQDVKLYKKESVLFNFGSIQIEKKGKIVFENEKLIRIKNENGKIEKIYKNGAR